MSKTIEDVLEDDIREQWVSGQIKSLMHSGFSETKALQIAPEQWQELKTKIASLQREGGWIGEKEFKEKIMDILTDHIHFSPQVQGYIVHGAIDKIWQFVESLSTPCEELKKRISELEEGLANLVESCTTSQDKIVAPTSHWYHEAKNLLK